MSLMPLREWDSRRALEAFTIKCLMTLCPQGDKPCLWQKPLCRWEAHIWRETLGKNVTSELLNKGSGEECEMASYELPKTLTQI